MNFETVFDEIQANKINHEDGYYNCIPFTGMDRFERFLPGIEQDTYYLITASSGVGKSKLGRSLFVQNPFSYVENNPDSGIELSVKYFSLEESKKKIVLTEISKYLYEKHALVVSIKELQSRGRYNTLASDTLDKIAEASDYVNRFLDKVDIIDSIRNPTGIYKYVRDYAMEIGKYYDENNNPLTEAQHQNIKFGRGDDFKKISYYKKDNPKHYVIVLVDHISLLENENGLTQWQTITKFSSDYCLRFRDKFGFTPVVIQQQASGKEQVEYNYKGDSIEEKLEPSLDGLGDNKTTQRDANVVLGLFAPDRYGIREHNEYDISFFRDRYRSLNLLKDRDGVANKKVPLFFNGATDFFKELPRVDNAAGMQQVKNYVINLNRNR